MHVGQYHILAGVAGMPQPATARYDMDQTTKESVGQFVYSLSKQSTCTHVDAGTDMATYDDGDSANAEDRGGDAHRVDKSRQKAWKCLENVGKCCGNVGKFNKQQQKHNAVQRCVAFLG